MKPNQRRTPWVRKRRKNRMRERWDTMLAGIIEMSRILSYNLDVDALWDALHDHINLMFDTSSFFVALHDYERDCLLLPLVSDDGMRIDHDPIPVVGMSRAMLTHGIEFYVQDMEREAERLTAIGVELDEREPGRWALSWIGVPIRSRQSEVTGLVALQNVLPGSFDDEDLSLLMAMTAPISMALDNARLMQTERERRLIAAALMEIGQMSGASLDYDDVLERILDQLQRIASYDSAAILLAEVEDDSRLIVGATHDPDVFTKGMELVAADLSPLAQSFLSQQPIIAADADDFAAWWETPPEITPRGRSWLVVPLVVRQRTTGLILMSRVVGTGGSASGYDVPAPPVYTQKDASSAFALARQGAVTLETARLQVQSAANLQILQQRARRLASINRITSVITSSLDRDEVLRAAAQFLTELFEVDHCGIVMLHPDADEAALTVEYPALGFVGLRIPANDANITMAALKRLGEAVAIEDIEDSDVDNATRDALRTVGVRSTLIAPLIARDRVIGTIGIDMLHNRRSFTAEERETLVTVAGQVAMAVANAELYEAALDANRLKSAFLANISHELRTPLNAIIGYTDMLLDEFYGGVNDQQRDRLLRVSGSGRHLLGMIDDVLDLAKIEAGEVVLEPSTIRVSDVLDDLAAGVLAEAQAKGLAFERVAAPDEPPIRADPRFLRQIIAKLLTNALKFTDKGGIRVETLPLATFNGSTPALALPERFAVPDGEWLALRVADTGVGIKPEHREIIFESFRQADESSIREFGGTGMGLAITRRLVDLHHGFIWVESQPDAGSTFTLLLPAYHPSPRPEHR